MTQQPLPFNPKSSTRMAHAVGAMLVVANSNPSSTGDKHRFYRLKERVCEKYGTIDGSDIQRITKECWSCDGCGVFHDGHECWKCGGSGIYDRRHILLERWNVGGFTFHRPDRTIWQKVEDDEVTIHGFVRHSTWPNGKAIRCTILLALLMRE